MSRKRYPKPLEDDAYLKSLHLKTPSQEHYVQVLHESTVTLCTGPAGTGKTYVAAHVGLELLLEGEVDKVVLTRPMVACEDIGYLPGDMTEKIHPYLMPLFDSIEAHVGPTRAKDLLVHGRIEVLPLAYMRGRTLNRAFVILDEAQNATREQVMMFLTRLGYDSRMVVNGDVTQSDLTTVAKSDNGLAWAVKQLRGKDADVALVEFTNRDIVRHPLISRIIQHLSGPAVKGNGDGRKHWPDEKFGSVSLTG